MTLQLLKILSFDEKTGATVGEYLETDTPATAKQFESKDSIIAKGKYLPEMENLLYEVEGAWRHTTNGKHFEIDEINFKVPDTINGRIAFLSCKSLEGVPIPLAIKVQKLYGSSTLELLANEKKDILKQGLTEMELDAVISAYKKATIYQDTIKYFLSKGGSTQQGVKFYKTYKENSRDILFNGIDPASLYHEAEYGDDIVEKILSAEEQNSILENTEHVIRLSSDQIERVKEEILLFVNMIQGAGHLYSPVHMIIKAISQKVKDKNLTKDSLTLIARQMVVDGVLKEVIVDSKPMFGLAKNLEKEIEVVHEIKRLVKNGKELTFSVNDAIYSNEKRVGFNINSDQTNAVRTALQNSVSVVTGGPGTGKTTIIKFITELFFQSSGGCNVLLTSPTGKAARRMAESTNADAMTIHSALAITPDCSRSNVTLDYDLIIVDESSMIDISLAAGFLRSVKSGCKVVFIGDVDQLPSVGAGDFLNDMIRSGVIPVARLNQVYRQKEGSCIAQNSLNIKNGSTTLNQGNDFTVIETSSSEESAEIMVKEYLKGIKTYGVKNVVLLSPVRKDTYKSGVTQMNLILREKVNPLLNGMPTIRTSKEVYRQNDRIIAMKNSNKASNGEVGTIIAISNQKATVDFEDRKEVLSPNDLEDVDFAYAISIHKSQGSEYKLVIMNMLKEHKSMLKRNLIYTGITRAKEVCVLVGDKEAMDKAIETDPTSHDKRRTALSDLLKEYL